MLRWCFFAFVVRPLVLVILGCNVRHRSRLPAAGPAIVAANHNSHLDTLVLMALFPHRMLGRLRPVAAADYFLRHRLRSWFAHRIMGIIPLPRGRPERGTDPLAACDAALDRGEILILFPEGTRGAPEAMADFKGGVARLAERHPTVPVVPVYLHGLGKALPRGTWVLVPFFVDVFVGTARVWGGDRRGFMDDLTSAIREGAEAVHPPAWE